MPPGQGRADALRTSQQRGSCSRPNAPLFYLIATSSHRDGNVSNPDTPKKNHHMLPSCTGLHPHKKHVNNEDTARDIPYLHSDFGTVS